MGSWFDPEVHSGKASSASLCYPKAYCFAPFFLGTLYVKPCDAWSTSTKHASSQDANSLEATQPSSPRVSFPPPEVPFLPRDILPPEVSKLARGPYNCILVQRDAQCASEALTGSLISIETP